MSNRRLNRVRGKKTVRHNGQTHRERQARAKNKGWLKGWVPGMDLKGLWIPRESKQRYQKIITRG